MHYHHSSHLPGIGRFKFPFLVALALLGSGLLLDAAPASSCAPPPLAASEEKSPRSFKPEDLDKALDLASRTLAFVEKTGPRPAFAKELNGLQERAVAARKGPPEDLSKLVEEVRALRRKIIFSHPLLGFEKLLINKNPPTTYSHNCDQYLGRHSRVGDGPTILENWKETPKETVLLKAKLPAGAYARLDLSYDAKKFLFAFADHTPKDPNLRRFFLYEAAIDGSQIRQITGTPRDPMATWQNRSTVLIEDSDPCYLPDGGIVFVSSRSQNFGRCHGGRYTPSFLLYRADADGGNIRQLSWGEANEVEPSVLPDGRIVYTRWEYIDRHEMEFHKLWTTRPDGTAPSNFYGNDTIYPLMIAEALSIPGTRKVVATAMAHHTFNHGTTIVIDPEKGENGSEPIARVTPEVRFPESDEHGGEAEAFASPYPLSEDLFLAAYSNVKITFQGQVPPPDSFSIYLVDSLGGRELIFKDPNLSCFSPIPIRPRSVPPALPSALPPSSAGGETGVYLVQNVYLTRNDPQSLLKAGEIKALRFNEMINKPAAHSNYVSGPVPNELPKRILGTVPVNPDGSVAAIVPAGVPLQVQALDKNGMAIMTERSFHYLQPGEIRSCVGCHEPVGSAPPSNRSLTNCRPVALTPPTGPRYEGGLSFLRTVQPVLDRYCIDCHGLKEQAGSALNLIGMQGHFPGSYNALILFTKTIGDKELTHGLEKNISRPRDYYAAGGKLGALLLSKHHDVSLDRESFQRVIDWLDVNAQCYGDYSWNRVENRHSDRAGEKALRAYLLGRFGKELAAQPFPALVNVAQPKESRVLMAPLAIEAGGWGQIAQGGWKSSSDPDYQKACQLVEASIASLATRDIDGTCGRTPCVCGSCWVRKLKESGVK